jgi:hypothetical protein
MAGNIFFDLYPSDELGLSCSGLFFVADGNMETGRARDIVPGIFYPYQCSY